MNQEEDNEECRHQPVAHFAVVVVVLDSPEAVAEQSAEDRKKEVNKTVDVKAF